MHSFALLCNFEATSKLVFFLQFSVFSMKTLFSCNHSNSSHAIYQAVGYCIIININIINIIIIINIITF